MFHNVRFKILVSSIFASVIVLLVLSAPLLAQDTMKSDTTPVHLWSDGSEIKDTASTLTRYDNGVSMTLHTSGLTPGDVVTAWWVVFNKPENCSDNDCGDNDLFMFDASGNMVITNGDQVLNQPQINAAQASILSATANVIPDSGEGHFAAWLGTGEMTGVVFGSGLQDPDHAAIFIVLRSHGPVQADALDKQMTDQWGGCGATWPHTPCENVQVAIHTPPASS